MRGESIRPQPKPAKVAKARKPLKRSRMKKRTSRRVKRKTAEDRRFLAWIHRQKCAGFGSTELAGTKMIHWCGDLSLNPIQAAHFRDHTGIGLCEAYSTCIPLCKSLHDDYDGRDPSILWDASLDARKDWHRARQKEVRARYLAEIGQTRLP